MTGTSGFVVATPPPSPEQEPQQHGPQQGQQPCRQRRRPLRPDIFLGLLLSAVATLVSAPLLLGLQGLALSVVGTHAQLGTWR